MGGNDVGRLRLLERVHRVLAQHVVGDAEGEEGVHALMLTMSRDVAVIPGGAELGQIDRKEPVEMDKLAGLAEGQELTLQQRVRLLAG